MTYFKKQRPAKALGSDYMQIFSPGSNFRLPKRAENLARHSYQALVKTDYMTMISAQHAGLKFQPAYS